MSYLTVSDNEIAAYAPVTARTLTKVRDNYRAAATQHLALESAITASDTVRDGTWISCETFSSFLPVTVCGESGTRANLGADLYLNHSNGPLESAQLFARLYHPDSGATGDEFTLLGASAVNSSSELLTVDFTASASGFTDLVIQIKTTASGGSVVSLARVALQKDKFVHRFQRLPAEGY